MDGEVSTRVFDIAEFVFGVEDVQGVSPACRVGAVVIKGALEDDRQSLEIVLMFDYVIVGAGLECGHGRLLVAHAGDQDDGKFQAALTNVSQEGESAPVTQVHVR